MVIDELFIQRRLPEEAGADAPVIVLVHGAPDRSGTFSALLPLLADRRIVSYDRRGYGRSVDAAPPTSMRDHAHDLLAIIDSLGEPCVVAAHSFGSNPTMLAATLDPDAFVSLGLWEPPLVWTDPWLPSTKAYHQRVADSSDPGGVVEEIFRLLLGSAVWEGTPADLRARRRAEGVAFQVDMATSLVAPFEFADVTVPAVVGHGTETSGGHVEGAQWLADQLPNAVLHSVPGVGHFAPRTHPGAYADFVRLAASLVSPS